MAFSMGNYLLCHCHCHPLLNKKKEVENKENRDIMIVRVFYYLFINIDKLAPLESFIDYSPLVKEVLH